MVINCPKAFLTLFKTCLAGPHRQDWLRQYHQSFLVLKIFRMKYSSGQMGPQVWNVFLVKSRDKNGQVTQFFSWSFAYVTNNPKWKDAFLNISHTLWSLVSKCHFVPTHYSVFWSTTSKIEVRKGKKSTFLVPKLQ